MTLKEFLEKNPDAVKKAANCKSVDEFKNLTKDVGITFDSKEDLDKAFNLVKSQNNGELSDDALNAVSGGTVYGWDSKRVAWSNDGSAITLGTGQKQKGKNLR